MGRVTDNELTAFAGWNVAVAVSIVGSLALLTVAD